MQRMMYLVLVHCVRLKCFISTSSSDIPADECCRATVEALGGSFQPAVHLVVKNPSVGLSWRGPGEQEGGLQAALSVSLKVQQWR